MLEHSLKKVKTLKVVSKKINVQPYKKISCQLQTFKKENGYTLTTIYLINELSLCTI